MDEFGEIELSGFVFCPLYFSFSPPGLNAYEVNGRTAMGLKNNPGIENARKIFGDTFADHLVVFWGWELISPDFAEEICNHAYGKMYSRDVLTQATRELCAIMALACLDKPVQLKAHLAAARRNGASWPEIMEVLLQCHVYAGIPAQMNAIVVARELYEEAEDTQMRTRKQ